MDLISSEIRTARKYHQCDACAAFYRSGLDADEFDADDRASIDAASDDVWCITPGQKYLRQAVKIDGLIFTFRARLDIDLVCRKHGLYQED